MIVIADTTPLNPLILIDQASILEALYARVIAPAAVLSELQAQGTPPKVMAWISHRPAWLEVDPRVFAPDPALAHLDAGERDAIILAQDLRAYPVSEAHLWPRNGSCGRGQQCSAVPHVLSWSQFLRFYCGRSRAGTSTRMDRAMPGVRSMSPFFSRLMTI